jgi:hypothetical protein
MQCGRFRLHAVYTDLAYCAFLAFQEEKEIHPASAHPAERDDLLR